MQNLDRSIRVRFEGDDEIFSKSTSHSLDTRGMCAAAHVLINALNEHPQKIESFSVEVFDDQADKCIHILEDGEITKLLRDIASFEMLARLLRSIEATIQKAYFHQSCDVAET